MQPFSYARAGSVLEAVAAGAGPGTAYLAGGTELLNWMRLGILEPARVLDISRLPGLDQVEALPGGGLRIGALVRLNDAAGHPAVARDAPVLSQAVLKAASAQLRNLATVGGNPVQRTRCAYYRAEEPLPCNKRQPGSGCSALHGENSRHAIFGWTEACVATQPSDPAVALAALDAVLVTEAATSAQRGGGRRIPARAFHTLPARQSAYLKVRERESYEYATVSAAAALDAEDGVIRRARVALGSVAHRPWRLDAAERRLGGVRLDDRAALRTALDASFAEARPLSGNAYKVPLARNAALRALEMAGGMPA